MIEILNWIVSSWYNTLISIVMLLILSNVRLINVEISNGGTYIEKVDSDE